MASIITPYERHLIVSYLHNLVTRAGDNRLLKATDRECLPEWIHEHADLLQCESLPADTHWSRSCLNKALRHLREQTRRVHKDTTARYLRQLGKMADLSHLDLAILEALVRYKTQPIIESLMDQIDHLVPHYIFSLRNPLLGGLLGVSMRTIRERVSPGAPLLRSGLVSFDSDNDLRLVKRLVRLGGATERGDQDVTSLLLGDPAPTELAWSDFDHLGVDRKHIRKIVQGALQNGTAGVNILLYGAPGTGKTEFTKVLAARLGVNLFSIGESDDDGDEPSRLERLQELRMAHLLARDRKSILLFDEMEDLLASEDERFALGPLFSSRARGSEGSKVFLNRMLEKSPVPTIWVMNDARAVSPVILRRMMFALELRLPPASVRTAIWQRQLYRHGIEASPETAAALAREFEVTPGVTEGAIRAAALVGGGVETVRRGVNSLVRVLPRESTARESEPPERYEPSLTRADTDLCRLADRIAASESRRFSLCLEGPPGTGKSAYVRYLAGRLGLPVLQKRASDLLSPFVGETEQRLAAAFDEARAGQALLVFDEADSLLADRRGAHRNWEITAVNEMLTWMESHPLPFACTTNLGTVLDPATLRRFLFKVTLGYLRPAQSRAAFQLFFDQPAPAEVATLANLTPADFALIRKQAAFRGCMHDSAALAALLRAECQAKPDRGAGLGFGQ